MVDEVMRGGENKSVMKDEWARRKFNQWRKSRVMDFNIPIEKMDMREFNEQLQQFLLQVIKLNGKRYPSESLMNMFRCFG